MPTHLENLRQWLNRQPSGPISDKTVLTELLKNAWPEIQGSDAESTSASKLPGRVEKPSWNSPVLTFIIERHGATVKGSTRADLHQWTIDVDQATAVCNPKHSYRQLRKAAPPLDVAPLAQGINVLVPSQSSSAEAHRWLYSAMRSKRPRMS